MVKTRSFGKLLVNDFDYKACLIWTAIGVIVVFGAVQIGKVCLKKSEKKSEEWRIKQQIPYTPSPPPSGRYRNMQVIYTPVHSR